MPQYDNPAGRLHAKLQALAEVPPSKSLATAWSQVLEVPQDELVLALAPVAALIGATEAAVQTTGEPAYARTVVRYRSEWSRLIFPTGKSFSQQLATHGQPDQAALEALDMVSSHLHRTAPEGRVPEADAIADLESKLSEVIDGVRATNLDDEIKHLLLDRLQDVLRALGHVSTGGPGAVRFAIEALLGAMAVSSDTLKQEDKGTVSTVLQVLSAVYVAFTAGPVIQASLTAWPHVIHFLGQG